MQNTRDLTLTQGATIREALSVIDGASAKIALVTDDRGRLVGTVSDGDIRRGMLRGLVIGDAVDEVMNRTPLTFKPGDSRAEVSRVARERRIAYIPVIDEAGILTGLYSEDELERASEKPNLVVLMAGGLGTRLRPLTHRKPKPMLEVGGRPILETIIAGFAERGFRRFVICTNYMSEVIRDHFGDGSRLGIEIRYVHERNRLGTAGALSLLDERPTEPFFVMNGDLLTNVDYTNLVRFHYEHDAAATVCVRRQTWQIPYGVIEMRDGVVVSITEKPTQDLFVNAGIYLVNPSAVDQVPRDEFFDMPDLLERLVAQGQTVVSFPIHEYWIDVGHKQEYDKANTEFDTYFDV